MGTEATIILFDVSSSSVGSNSPTFYEQAKNCVVKKITNKLVLKPKDQIALISYGSKDTNNVLNDSEGGYQNIDTVIKMEPVSWEMLGYVERQMESHDENISANWLEALIVSISYFRYLALKKCSKKVILFTTLTADVENEKAPQVIEDLRSMEIELIVITTDVICDENPDNSTKFDQAIAKSQARANGEDLILQLLGRTHRKLYNLNEAVSELVYAEKNPAKRTVSNFDLSIGKKSKIIIKVAVLIYVQDKPVSSYYKPRVLMGRAIEAGRSFIEPDSVVMNVPADVKVEPTEPDIVEEEVDLGIETEPMEIENPSITIKDEIQDNNTSAAGEGSSSSGDQTPLYAGNGNSAEITVQVIAQPCSSKIDHYHGDNLIAPETVAETVMKGYIYDGEWYEPKEEPSYENGGKGLRCHGFTKTNTIRTEYLDCETIRKVIPQKRFPSSVKRFSALLEAMQREDLTLIARYTNNDRGMPDMMALIPSQDCMLMYRVSYGREIISSRSINFLFPRLRRDNRFTPSPEQYNCMDKFIDSMDLMGDNQSPEFFKYLRDPGFQHQCNSLAYAVLNPNDDLPEHGEDVQALITTPKELNSNDLEEMKSLF